MPTSVTGASATCPTGCWEDPTGHTEHTPHRSLIRGSFLFPWAKGTSDVPSRVVRLGCLTSAYTPTGTGSSLPSQPAHCNVDTERSLSSPRASRDLQSLNNFPPPTRKPSPCTGGLFSARVATVPSDFTVAKDQRALMGVTHTTRTPDPRLSLMEGAADRDEASEVPCQHSRQCRSPGPVSHVPKIAQ